jgi:hypothetical protein
MIRAGGLALLIALAGCSHPPPAPGAAIPSVCEDQVYADPVVKDLIMKGAGSESFRASHMNQLKDAKLDAARRCMLQKGIAQPG